MVKSENEYFWDKRFYYPELHSFVKAMQSVCGIHQQLSLCFALYCSLIAFLKLLMVRFVLMATNLGMFFLPFHNFSLIYSNNFCFPLRLISDGLCRRTYFSNQASGLNLSKSETVWTKECMIPSVSFQADVWLGSLCPSKRWKLRKVWSVFCAPSWFLNCSLSSRGNWDVLLFAISPNASAESWLYWCTVVD